MEPVSAKSLFVTHVEKEGPFLKVWGQTDKNASIEVEQALIKATLPFDQGLYRLREVNCDVGVLCCAKYNDNKYYRARITDTTAVPDGFVEVNFLDYGNRDIVPLINLRTLECFNSSFISLPPLALALILAEVVCIGGEWNEKIVEEIANEIKYIETSYYIVAHAVRYFFIKIFVGDVDFGLHLVSKGYMQRTSIQTQEAVLLAMVPRNPQPNPAKPTLLAYKAYTLEPGVQHAIYVSYITDGPCHFSVQLKKYEDALAQLMHEINSTPLKLLEELPLPGTVCLAKCLEDGNICRAVVTSEVDSQFKIFYVDFGNSEVVPSENLYQISFKHVIPKVMAIRLSLAGIEKSTMTIEMQCAFKKFVDNRLLYMEVIPSPSKLALPKCRLWDPETNTDVRDVINRAAMNAYPEPTSLTRGFTQLVTVSFVYSCKRFYVQLKSRETDLAKLMLDLQDSCQMAEDLPQDVIRLGLPCAALFSADMKYYRSLIVDIIGNSGTVKVRYIDYGNEEEIPSTSLKAIEGELLTVLRPQAIECSLNGYQNMTEDTERDNLLEELILEQEFTMKVVEMLNGKALVELIDESNYNVASLLLDKIASARSQVSPALIVQGDNRIEHRKNSIKMDGNRNNQRDQKWNDKSNTNWRNNNAGHRNENDDCTNDDTWKQNRGHNRHNRSGSETSQDGGFKKPYRDRNENEDTWDKGGNDFAKPRDNWSNNRDNRPPRDRGDWNGGRNNSNKDTWDAGASRGGDFKRKNQTDTWGNENNHGGKGDGEESWENNHRRNDFKQKGESWGRENSFSGKSDEGNSWGDKTYKQKDFRGNRERPNSDKGNWKSGPKQDRFNKKPPFAREASELSSSGSEKSFKRGPRTSSRNESRPPKFNKKSGSPSFGAGGDSWNVSSVSNNFESAPSTAQYKLIDVIGQHSKIAISWFHNPSAFYCQVEESQEAFKKLMEDIQYAYKDRKPSSCPKGAPVVGLFPEDNVLYRARILEIDGTDYKVHYVDFGNVSTVTKVWPIETKFMELPAQAIFCGLNGIRPVQGDWPDNDCYSTHFDKESFQCHFMSNEEGRYLVQLTTSDGADVAQQLVQDNLAAFSEPVIHDFELSFLLCQQFRAMIKSVASLSDFTLLLQDGTVLLARMHNLDLATETFEEVLKSQIDQILIVYVDNIVEERLEVTLYDSTGNKLQVINPDDGSLDTVETLCPYLVTRPTLYGFVSHVNEDSIVLQPSENADNIVYLVEQLYEYYEKITLENPIIPEEGFIYAVRSSDGNWYRARVTSFNDEKAAVTYVDYGNSEEVLFTELRELVDEFIIWNIMALQVFIKESPTNYLEKDVVVTVRYGENGWEGDIKLQEVSEQKQPPVEEVDINLTTLHDTPVEQIQEATEAINFPGIPVVISHIDSPSDFYIQHQETLETLDELQLNLQKEVTEMPDLENPSTGVLCAAPYSADQQWYRAQVLDGDDDITTVRFVDYGNTDVLDNKATKIKTLSPNLLSLEVYSTRCRLKIKPVDGEWSTAASERFEQLTSAEHISVEFLDEDEKSHYVELYANGTNVKNILLEEALAIIDEETAETNLAGFVSHLNSPSEFWLQMESCTEELESIAEKLSVAETFPDLEDLTPGTLCAAMFPDDQMWYRGRILSNTVAGLEVLFLDYGNSCICSNMKQLPEDLIMMRPLAQKCSLNKPPELAQWSAEAGAKFSEISEDGATVFTVRKLTSGETAIVELRVDGNDVSLMLLASEGTKPAKDSQELVTTGETTENVSGNVEETKLENDATIPANSETDSVIPTPELDAKHEEHNIFEDKQVSETANFIETEAVASALESCQLVEAAVEKSVRPASEVAISPAEGAGVSTDELSYSNDVCNEIQKDETVNETTLKSDHVENSNTENTEATDIAAKGLENDETTETSNPGNTEIESSAERKSDPLVSPVPSSNHEEILKESSNARSYIPLQEVTAIFETLQSEINEKTSPVIHNEQSDVAISVQNVEDGLKRFSQVLAVDITSPIPEVVISSEDTAPSTSSNIQFESKNIENDEHHEHIKQKTLELDVVEGEHDINKTVETDESDIGQNKYQNCINEEKVSSDASIHKKRKFDLIEDEIIKSKHICLESSIREFEPEQLLENECDKEKNQTQNNEDTSANGKNVEDGCFDRDISRLHLVEETETRCTQECIEADNTETKDEAVPIEDKHQTSNLEQNNASLKANLTPSETNLTPLEANLTHLEAELTPLEANQTPLEENLTPLEGNLTPLEGNMTPLEANLIDQNLGKNTIMYQSKKPLDSEDEETDNRADENKLEGGNTNRRPSERVEDGEFEIYYFGKSSRNEERGIREGNCDENSHRIKEPWTFSYDESVETTSIQENAYSEEVSPNVDEEIEPLNEYVKAAPLKEKDDELGSEEVRSNTDEEIESLNESVKAAPEKDDRSYLEEVSNNVDVEEPLEESTTQTLSRYMQEKELNIRKQLSQDLVEETHDSSEVTQGESETPIEKVSSTEVPTKTEYLKEETAPIYSKSFLTCDEALLHDGSELLLQDKGRMELEVEIDVSAVKKNDENNALEEGDPLKKMQPSEKEEAVEYQLEVTEEVTGNDLKDQLSTTIEKSVYKDLNIAFKSLEVESYNRENAALEDHFISEKTSESDENISNSEIAQNETPDTELAIADNEDTIIDDRKLKAPKDECESTAPTLDKKTHDSKLDHEELKDAKITVSDDPKIILANDVPNIQIGVAESQAEEISKYQKDDAPQSRMTQSSTKDSQITQRGHFECMDSLKDNQQSTLEDTIIVEAKIQNVAIEVEEGNEENHQCNADELQFPTALIPQNEKFDKTSHLIVQISNGTESISRADGDISSDEDLTSPSPSSSEDLVIDHDQQLYSIEETSVDSEWEFQSAAEDTVLENSNNISTSAKPLILEETKESSTTKEHLPKKSSSKIQVPNYQKRRSHDERLLPITLAQIESSLPVKEESQESYVRELIEDKDEQGVTENNLIEQDLTKSNLIEQELTKNNIDIKLEITVNESDTLNKPPVITSESEISKNLELILSSQRESAHDKKLLPITLAQIDTYLSIKHELTDTSENKIKLRDTSNKKPTNGDSGSSSDSESVTLVSNRNRLSRSHDEEHLPPNMTQMSTPLEIKEGQRRLSENKTEQEASSTNIESKTESTDSESDTSSKEPIITDDSESTSSENIIPSVISKMQSSFSK